MSTIYLLITIYDGEINTPSAFRSEAEREAEIVRLAKQHDADDDGFGGFDFSGTDLEISTADLNPDTLEVA